MFNFNHTFCSSLAVRPLCGAAALALTLGLGGCVGQQEAEETEIDRAPANLIASVQLANGARVDFHEPEPGRIIAIGTGDLPEVQEGPSVVAFYASLAKRAAPLALVEAQHRVDLARSRPSASRAPERLTEITESQPDSLNQQVQVRDGVSSSAQALTSAAFAAAYCAGSFNFNHCLTNRTGSLTIQVNSVDWMHVHVDAYRGQVRRKVSYRNFWGNWIILSDVNVTVATSVWDWSTTDNDTYKVEISEATGDGYHLAVHGGT